MKHNIALLLLLAPAAHALEFSLVSESSRLGPPGRHGVAAAALFDVPYVFGGCTVEELCSDELYAFHTSTSSWEFLRVRGDAPSARGGASLSGARGFLFLFGGESSEGTFNDVYKFDATWRKWYIGVGPENFRPEPRSGHAAASDGEKVYIFGGYNESGRFLNDLWIIDLDSELENLSPEQFPVRFHALSRSSGDIPSPREGATLTYLSGHLFLFGGYGAEGLRTSDLWVYSLAEDKWLRAPVRGRQPPPREGHSALRNGSDIIVAGGCDSRRTVQRCYNDVWQLDAKTYSWTVLSAGDPKFAPRERHGAVILKGGKVLLFCGRKLAAEDYSSVVAFSVSSCGGGAVCSGRGTCATASCLCHPGWASHDCGEVFDCPRKCNFSGICLNGLCKCYPRFHGNSCYRVLCPGSGLNGMCNGEGECLSSGVCACNPGYKGVACEIDIWGEEERARRAKGIKRRSPEHPTPDLSKLIDFDLREQMAAIWRDIVRETGGSLPPLAQIGELRGSATAGATGAGLQWSIHWPEAKLPSAAEVKEALQGVAEQLQEQLPSISTSVRVAMAPVSLFVALGTLYTMYSINKSRM